MTKTAFVTLSVRPETKKLLLDLVKKEFLRVHPEFEGAKITENMLCLRAFNYYIK